ncbi:MAG: SCO family protein [Pseudomonadota bacterium]
MSSSTSAANAPKRSLAPLWLVAAVAAFPFVGSLLLYLFGGFEGRVNYGDLIEPFRVPQEVLRQADGEPFRLGELEGKWILLQVDPGACPAACQQRLYVQRQVWKLQGKNMHRIERVWLTDDGVRPDPVLVGAAEGVRVVDARGSELLRRLPARGAVHDHLYVVDPLGNVMLRFPKDADPTLMKRDLARLLKASRIG